MKKIKKTYSTKLSLDTTNLQPADWDYIYRYNGYEDQGSGPGSTIENTLPLIYWLESFIANNNINSILDIGCGDLQWIPSLIKLLPSYVTYTGLDCVSSIIKSHKKRYPELSFIQNDIYSHDFTGLEDSYDLIICKDVLQHRVYDIDILDNNLKKIDSKITLLIHPESIPLTHSLIDYKWVLYYLADEKKSISIKIK